MRPVIDRLRAWARSIKRQIMVLWFSCRHPKAPWLAKALAVCVVAYALSPIDLIPDFIPVLGYLDDLILLPLGILLVMRLMPEEVLMECRIRATEWEKRQEPPPGQPAGRRADRVGLALGAGRRLVVLHPIADESSA